jgi:type IV pilus assembly protein PilA
MKKKQGFTLIELMIVILIVAVLAAILIPLMQGRLDRAKWSEANAGAGMINSAVRALVAEKANDPAYDFTVLQGGQAAFGNVLGITVQDLLGQYFDSAAYTISSVDPVAGACVVVVTPSGPNPPTNPVAGMTFDGVNGTWREN